MSLLFALESFEINEDKKKFEKITTVCGIKNQSSVNLSSEFYFEQKIIIRYFGVVELPSPLLTFY